ADLGEAAVGGGAVPAEGLEALAAGPDGLDLVAVVGPEGVEDGLQLLPLGVDQPAEPFQGDAVGLQPSAAGGGGLTLLGMALQAALHLGLALGEDPAALGQAGGADVEVLGGGRQLLASGGQDGQGGGGGRGPVGGFGSGGLQGRQGGLHLVEVGGVGVDLSGGLLAGQP